MESIPAGKVGSTEALVKENPRGCCGSSRASPPNKRRIEENNSAGPAA